MRVAQFIDTNTFGGAEVLVVELASALQAQGIASEIHHIGDNPRLVERAGSQGVELVSVPGTDLYRSKRTLPDFVRQYRSYLRARKVDVLHSHLVGPALAGGLSCAISRVKHIATLHDVYSLDGRTDIVRAFQVLSLLGTRFATVSADIENSLRSRAWFPRGRLSVVYNGLRLKKSARDVALRESLGLTDDVTVGITVGRLSAIKAHERIIEAIALLPKSLPYRHVFLGEGPERESLETLIRARDIADRVVFAGYREDVASVLSMSDLFILTSTSEGLSCSILEAMAQGLPVIATDVGGNREIVKNGETGFIVSATPRDIATQIERLVASPTLRQSLGHAGEKRFSELFSFELMLQRYQELYGL